MKWALLLVALFQLPAPPSGLRVLDTPEAPDMAIAVSVVQAYVNTTLVTAVSSAFDIATGDLIIVVGHNDQALDSSSDTMALTDNDADLAFTAGPVRGATDAGAGFVGMWSYLATRDDTGVVVTLTVTDGFSNDAPYLKIYRVTGFEAADHLGAVSEGNLTTDPQSVTLTMETAGVMFAAWTDWNQTGTPTSSDLTMTGFDDAGDISGGSGYKQTSAGAQTANVNSGGTPTGNWITFEVRPDAAEAAFYYGGTGLPMMGMQ